MGAVAYPELRPLVGPTGDAAIAAAIGELVLARDLPSCTEIALPVLYPSGSHVTVSVYLESDTFTVTDEGGGASEAEMAGVAPASFAAIAKHEARRVGAVCDSRAFFLMRVPVDRLAAAITILADLSRNTVATALERLAAKAQDKLDERLIGHLEHAFGGRNVEPRTDVTGASNVTHRVAALVTVDGRPVVFDTFTGHGGSFNAAVSKFFDISQRDDSPARVGVTPRRSELGDRLALIGSVSTVIELDAVDEVYRRAAA